ncbi:hypothetical protein [Marinomonas sp. GJ51-6]|uniref:hypothetical protein n=1 Tax=Marinomonas sp. GJ51-6 TaxID=2992802 RepID=UPI002934A744|nr:hypothetical protein [Marinomonas sp. GJ51-6]WOD07244.1 hypothetical protein ONZ50_16875 [Marinomonas sp. GJ51-6]
MKRTLMLAFSAIFTVSSFSANTDWQDTLDDAKGQTVYFNAWGGADNINAYIQ